MNDLPPLYNNKYFLGIYIDGDTLKQIEEQRGDDSRNRFINGLIKRGLTRVAKEVEQS